MSADESKFNSDNSQFNSPSKKAKSNLSKKTKETKKAGENTKSKNLGQNQMKCEELSNDSGVVMKPKGPYIHIEGKKEAPKSVNIVNSCVGRGEEKPSQGRKHSNLSEVGRAKGTTLYNSTLGKFYPDEPDETWVCVFCKLPTHYKEGLGGEPAGDLFGPYFLKIPKEEVDISPSEQEVVAEQKKLGGGKKLSLRAAGVADQFISKFSKEVPESQEEVAEEDLNKETEVWVHEKCALWAPGVLKLGPHLDGLADAIATTSITKCSTCDNYGACIGCVARHCQSRAHYGCAVSSKWNLDQDTFIAKCPNHVENEQTPIPSVDNSS